MLVKRDKKSKETDISFKTLYARTSGLQFFTLEARASTLYTTFRVLYSPLYQAAMQAYLLSTIEEKSWAQMNKNTLFLV